MFRRKQNGFVPVTAEIFWSCKYIDQFTSEKFKEELVYPPSQPRIWTPDATLVSLYADILSLCTYIRKYLNDVHALLRLELDALSSSGEALKPTRLCLYHLRETIELHTFGGLCGYGRIWGLVTGHVGLVLCWEKTKMEWKKLEEVLYELVCQYHHPGSFTLGLGS